MNFENVHPFFLLFLKNRIKFNEELSTKEDNGNGITDHKNEKKEVII